MKKELTQEERMVKWFSKGIVSLDPVKFATTLKQAWEKSLTKWSEENATLDFLLSANNCGLCDMFISQDDCGKCPVAKVTGASTCYKFNAYRKLSNLENGLADGQEVPLDEVEKFRKAGLKQLLKIKAKSERKVK